MFNKSVFRYAQQNNYGDRTMPLKAAATPGGQCDGVATSSKWIAAPYGSGGSVIVLPLDFANFKRNDNPPLVSAHGSAVSDIKFNPFDQDCLVTGGEDGVVKLFMIPEGGLTQNISAPDARWDTASPIRCMAFHPSAEGIIAVGCKDGLRVIDITGGEINYTFQVDGFNKDIISVAWNEDGSKLAVLGKNSALHLIDPRTADADVLKEGFATVDTKKPQNVLWVQGQILLVAQGNTHKPYLALYDPDNLGKHASKTDLNLSAGFCIVTYDQDSKLLFVTLRGSTIMIAFDCSPAKPGKPPQCQEAFRIVTDNGMKGASLIPKYACNTDKCEVQRVISLTSNSVEHIGVKVTRKTAGFAPELYPDSNDCEPTFSPADYLGGKNQVPNKVQILKLAAKANGSGAAPAAAAAKPAAAATPAAASKAAEAAPKAAAAAAPKAAAAKPKPTTSNGFTSSISNDAKSFKPAERRTTIAYSATAKRAELDAKLKTSAFKHLEGKEPRQQHEFWYKLQPSTGCYLSKNLSANSKYWACPSKLGNNSTIIIQNNDKPCRMVEKPNVLRGHKAPITCFELSAIDDSCLVSGAQDGEVRVWKIPEGGLKSDLCECEHSFQTAGKVTVASLSPRVDGLLATACTSAEGHTVQVWDIKAGKEECCIEGFHNDQIIDLKFDRRGQLLASTAKDGMLRVLDIRDKETVCEVKVVESLRDTQICWVNDDLIAIYGTGRGSKRSLSMWNIRTQKCLTTVPHNMDSATYLGHYDEDMGVLFTGNNGGTTVQMWKLTAAAPYIEMLNTYQSPAMFQGFAFMPKRAAVDVKKVQVAHGFKLVMDQVIPIRWTILRKRKDYFQDDLFCDTWDGKAICDATEWFAGKFPQGSEGGTVSLKPSDMTNLSEAPPEELTVRQERYNAFNTKKDEPKKKGVLGHESAEEVAAHFTEVAQNMPTANRFDASYDETAKDVDEDEWD